MNEQSVNIKKKLNVFGDTGNCLSSEIKRRTYNTAITVVCVHMSESVYEKV